MPHGSFSTTGSFIPCTFLETWRVIKVLGYVPLGGQVLGQVSLCLSLAPPAKVRKIAFRSDYFKFCFGYYGYTGYTGYLSLSRLCHQIFCSSPLYFVFSSWAKTCIY
jgi:hypothetical protein